VTNGLGRSVARGDGSSALRFDVAVARAALAGRFEVALFVL
jgi:hypothetical protein